MKHYKYIFFSLVLLQANLFGQLTSGKDQKGIVKLLVSLQMEKPNFFNTFLPYCLTRYQKPLTGINPAFLPLVDLLIKELDSADTCQILVRKSIEAVARYALTPAIIKKIGIEDTSSCDVNLDEPFALSSNRYRIKIGEIIQRVQRLG
jgi:hypothetical protein